MNVATLLAYFIALAIPVLTLVLMRAFDSLKTTDLNLAIVSMLWGAFGAFSIAYVVNNGFVRLVGFDNVPRLTAPIIEEILKGVILYYFIRQPRWRYFVDGAVYGFAAGIGFAVLENFFYIANSGNAALSVAVTRVISTSLMHATASAVVGIALGRLRRMTDPIQQFALIGGIIFAIGVHIFYNNAVLSLSGLSLLLVAIAIGIGGGLIIAYIIRQGVKDEKESFTETLDVKTMDVATGEVKAIQRLGDEGLQEQLEKLRKSFGDENTELIRRLLITQANIGILQNNLSSVNVPRHLREAWEEEIAERREEFQQIRRELGVFVASHIETLFPREDLEMSNYLQNELSRSDPTLVHTFDMFMRTSGLAESFTPEQLEERAERLKKIDIFKDVKLADLENLSRAMETATFENGEMIFDQGDEGDAMYLIESGGLNIFTATGEGEKFLRTFEPGQVVGEFSVLDGGRRSARARAHDTLSVLVLKRPLFTTFIQSRPQVILPILAVLAEKARYTTRTVEASHDNLSRLMRGEYTLTQETAPAVPTAPTAAGHDAEAEEIPSRIQETLMGVFAGLASVLRGREGHLTGKTSS